MDIKFEDQNEFQDTTKSLNNEGVKSIQGIDISKDEWVDRGIIDVPVKDLPAPDDVNSPDDFHHHISWDDAKTASEQLPGIQADVNAGKTAEDFSREDENNGLDWKSGNRRIYDLYYGNDPVVVDKDGNDYTIVSGRHRIFIAKELGLETIPAKVIEKVSILD